MGLGKTVQVAAYLAALKRSKLAGQTEGRPLALIVCPATVLGQWVSELHVWHPPLRVVLCHTSAADARDGGTRAAAVASVLRRGDIVVTTYETLRRHRALLLPHRWEYAILDEGHRIRNPDADITLVCKQLRTVHRLVLTGAPIQARPKTAKSPIDPLPPSVLE